MDKKLDIIKEEHKPYDYEVPKFFARMNRIQLLSDSSAEPTSRSIPTKKRDHLKVNIVGLVNIITFYVMKGITYLTEILTFMICNRQSSVL